MPDSQWPMFLKDTGGGKQTHRCCDALSVTFLGGENPEGTDVLTKGAGKDTHESHHFFCHAYLAKLLLLLFELGLHNDTG